VWVIFTGQLMYTVRVAAENGQNFLYESRRNREIGKKQILKNFSVFTSIQMLIIFPLSV